jgi:hypothetical protein
VQTTNREIAVEPGDVIIFYDKRFPPDPGSGTANVPATNRVAVVVNERGALFLGRGVLGKKVEILPLGPVAPEKNIQIRKSPYAQHADAIADYFMRQIHKPAHFEAGLRALYFGNLQPFLTGTLFPVRPTYNSDDEYDSAWTLLKNSLKPMDTIFTVDTSSTVSKFIAWATHGPWSHVAVHVNEGEIWESVLSGIRTVPIETYKGRRYWIAAYRLIEAIEKPISAEKAHAVVSSHPFRLNSYNYYGALKHGLKAFLQDHSHGLVPNSKIFQGNYVLIAQV